MAVAQRDATIPCSYGCVRGIGTNVDFRPKGHTRAFPARRPNATHTDPIGDTRGADRPSIPRFTRAPPCGIMRGPGGVRCRIALWSQALRFLSGAGVHTMNNETTTSSAFHKAFDANARTILEPVREQLLESVESASPEEIIGQMLMILLCDDPMTAETKVRLVRMADHMGPDYCQALYHAAVFMTKVA